jgi:general stress protein 26
MALEFQNDQDAQAMLAGAAKAIKALRYCWLVNRDGETVQARPMGHQLLDSGKDLQCWFLADLRSRKVSALRRNATINIIFYDERDDAYDQSDRLWSAHPGARGSSIALEGLV